MYTAFSNKYYSIIITFNLKHPPRGLATSSRSVNKNKCLSCVDPVGAAAVGSPWTDPGESGDPVALGQAEKVHGASIKNLLSFRKLLSFPEEGDLLLLLLFDKLWELGDRWQLPLLLLPSRPRSRLGRLRRRVFIFWKRKIEINYINYWAL